MLEDVGCIVAVDRLVHVERAHDTRDGDRRLLCRIPVRIIASATMVNNAAVEAALPRLMLGLQAGGSTEIASQVGSVGIVSLATFLLGA